MPAPFYIFSSTSGKIYLFLVVKKWIKAKKRQLFKKSFSFETLSFRKRRLKNCNFFLSATFCYDFGLSLSLSIYLYLTSMHTHTRTHAHTHSLSFCYLDDCFLIFSILESLKSSSGTDCLDFLIVWNHLGQLFINKIINWFLLTD